MALLSKACYPKPSSPDITELFLMRFCNDTSRHKERATKRLSYPTQTVTSRPRPGQLCCAMVEQEITGGRLKSSLLSRMPVF